jgi:hypothetical protein
MAAPPAMQYFTLEKSNRSAFGKCRIAKYMVGTPAKSVTSSRSTISSAFSGVKRGSRVKVPPTAMDAFWMQVCPKE